MPHTFTTWTESTEPFEVVDVSAEGGWERLRRDYSNIVSGTSTMSASGQLERVIEVAKSLGVSSVLIEYRYVDADWRSEHTNFYGSTFVRYPSVCHRLHFFASKLSGELTELDDKSVRDAYRGYSIMRPLPETPVGRTMMTPPPELHGAIVTEATEEVHLFGADLSVTGMPFISQDAMYLRCAHASIWMVLRHAHLRHALPRRLPGDIRDAGVGGVVVGRQLPSDGLSTAQMLGALDMLGLPTGQLKPLPDLGPNPAPEDIPDPGAPTLYGIACRYVNSQLPPIVVSATHCWVIVGWRRVRSEGHNKLTLWRHDDARGPYIKVENPWGELEADLEEWQHILPPLLPKMNLDAERAELAGAVQLERMIRTRGEADPKNQSRAYKALISDRLTWRTFAVSSSEFKGRLRRRRLPETLERIYRLVQLPRYVWVVEAVDRDARDAQLADVLGTAIFDSTHAGARRTLIPPLAGHVEDYGFFFLPDSQQTFRQQLEHGDAVLGDHIVRNTHATEIPPRDTQD